MYSITLQNAGGDNVIGSGDKIGRINFAASAESDGGAATYIASYIACEAEGSFSSSSNPAGITFATSSSDSLPATGRLNISSDGNFLPIASGQYDLGSPSLPFRNLYVDGGYVTAPTGVFDTISFNVDNESILSKGEISWSDTEGSLTLGLTDNTTVSVGENRYLRIRNETGGTLYKGQAVYATGVHSNGLITPDLYVADGTIREIRFMGIVLEDVNDNNNGYALDFGQIIDMDLDGSASNYAVGDETWVAGDILYVHPTGAGKLTKVEPKHSISVAIVLDPGTGNGNGRMFVRPTSYGHLNDNHDVDVSGLLNNQFLVYDSGTDYWQPSSGLYYVDGDLGIGTATPSVKLDVDGQINSTNALNNKFVVKTNSIVAKIQPYDATSATYIGNETNHKLIFRTNNSDRVIITNGGDVGIGVDPPSEKLDVNGTIQTRTGGIGHEDDGCYVAYPGGGTYRGGAPTETGYLKITLPVSWTNTMLSFDIDIYEFASQKIKKLRVGGYTYAVSTQWFYESAMMDSDNDFAKYKVHFGHDGSKCAIYISEIGANNIDQGSSTVWSYPQISISNFFGGFSNFTMANWADGWDVGFTTTLGTINNTIQVSRPYRQHDTSYVFNEYGGDVDFRVEGSGDPNLLFTDASTDRVGIGTPLPAYKLDVAGSGSFDALNINDQYTFPTTDGSANQIIQTNGSGTLSWTDLNTSIDDNSITFSKLSNSSNESENVQKTTAKAWVNFNGAFGSSPFTIANGGIRDAFNVSSIIDNGVGIYTINFTNPMEDADYSVAGICSANVMGIIWDGGATYTRTVSAYQFATLYVINFTGSGSVFDASKIQVIIFR